MRNVLLNLSVVLLVCVLCAASVYAADGSGTNVVNPTSAVASSSGNAFTFTYTAAEALYDGAVRVTAPSGWNVPQDVSGTAGYTTVSTTGTLGNSLNTIETATGWGDDSLFVTLSTDSTVKKQGSASLKATVTASTGLGSTYFNTGSAQDWSSYTKIGFWIRSSVFLALGDAKFFVSETTNGTVPVIYNVASVSAGTWTYVVVDLSTLPSATRDAVLSYGFQVPLNAASTFNFDAMTVGPTTPTFSGQTVTAPLLQLASGGTITVTYGAGGGASGVTAPATTGAHVFTTAQKIDSAGTLTNLVSSPSITVTSATPPGATITQSGGSTAVTEGGATDSYTVVLDSQPTATVVISTTGGAQATALPSTLTFTTSNWDTPQTVTVTAVDDAAIEDTHSQIITHGASSSDTNYAGINLVSVTATITDNDPAAGATITQSGGNTAVTEGGATDSYTVALNTPPVSDVVITVTGGSGAGVSPTTLTFTTLNYGTAQTVTVTAVNDAIAQGTHTQTITHSAASTDPLYSGISISSVVATVTDNDSAGVSVVESDSATAVTEGGATDSYTVVLTTAPTDEVVVTVSPDAHIEVSPSSLTFTAVNYDIPQTITVSAVDDANIEGAHTGTITHSATSSDTTYDGSTVPSVEVSITDNDTSGGESGGTAQPTTVRFWGKAFPGARITLFEKDFFGSPLETRATTESIDGLFSVQLQGMTQAVHQYLLGVYDDSTALDTPLQNFRIDTMSTSTTEKEIIAPPSVVLARTYLTRGDFLKVTGKALPTATVRLELEDGLLYEAVPYKDGTYDILINTTRLAAGAHRIRARQVLIPRVQESGFSVATSFRISNTRVARTDLNSDGQTSITDWSMLLSKWEQKDAYTPQLDFNADGVVNTSDFSIFLKEFTL